MKATLYSYDDEGKTHSKIKVECYYASSEKTPSFEVNLPSTGLKLDKRLNWGIRISAKELISLFFTRIIKKINDQS